MMKETLQFSEVFLTFREASEFFEQTMIERAGLNYEMSYAAIEYSDYRFDVTMSFERAG